MKKVLALALLMLLASISAPASEQKVPAYPAFIFGHIVWEDESTSDSLRELVKGYRDRDIPISGVIIDSPWETYYNNFSFDRQRFPDYEKLIAELKRQDLAVLLWTTSAVNTDNPDYQADLEKGYFAKGLEKYKWWKGTGGLIDYQNPEAMKYWHNLMNRALDLGIDGWKVDGVEGMVALKGISRQRAYSAAYYADFFNYGREHTGKPIVVMARGIEEFNEHSMGLPHWVNPLYLGPDIVFATHEVSFMTWTGDHDPTWNGMRDARRDFFKCVNAGYVSPGFDIGGYRAGKGERELFVRWAQWGAFVPFMENGGIAEHRPWKYGDEVVDIYRRLAVEHEELEWYLYSLLPERFAAGKSLVEKEEGENYYLGDSIFVAPIKKPGGKVFVELPDGNWRYWYDLSQTFPGGVSINQKFSLSDFPVYVKEGALIPLWVKSRYGGHLFNAAFAEQDTFWLLPGAGSGSRNLSDPAGMNGKVSWKRDAQGIELSSQGLKRPVVLLVEGISAPPKTVASSGTAVKKVECEAAKPGGDDEFCQREQKLFLELNPSNGKIEAKISF